VGVMPEAAVHEEDFVQSWEYEVGCARQLRDVKPVSVSKSVRDRPDLLLGLGVLPSDEGHSLASLAAAKCIHKGMGEIITHAFCRSAEENRSSMDEWGVGFVSSEG
jgi:hypothetical protein